MPPLNVAPHCGSSGLNLIAFSNAVIAISVSPAQRLNQPRIPQLNAAFGSIARARFNQKGTSTVWEDLFATEQDALNEAFQTIASEGIASFIGDPDQKLH